MSRQGNYVTVPNVGGSNAMSGLSGALTDLSKIMLARSEQEQDKKQWEAEEGRRIEDHNYKLDGRAANRDLAAFMKDLNENEFQYQLQHQNKDMQGHYNSIIAAKEAERDSLRSFLTNPEAVYASHGDLFAKGFEKSNLDPAKLTDRLFERERRALALRRELDGAGYTPEEREARLNQAIDELYNPVFEGINSKIASGDGMLRRERLNAIMSALPANIREHITQENLLATLGPAVGGITKDELIERHRNNVAAQNTAGAQNARDTNAHNRQLLPARGKSGSGFTKKSKTKYDELSELYDSEGKFNLNYFGGWLGDDNKEKERAIEYFMDYQTEDGQYLTPHAIKTIISRGIDDGKFGKTFPELKSDKFIALEKWTEKLVRDRRETTSSGGSYSTGSGGSGGVSRSALTYKPVEEQLLPELQRELLKFNNTTRYLGADSSYYSDEHRLLPSQRLPVVTDTPGGARGGTPPKAAGSKPTMVTDDKLPEPEAVPEVPKVIPNPLDPRAARLLADREAVLAYNQNFPEGDGIPTDTLFVHQHDAEGKARPWAEVVRDVNKQFEAQGWGGGWFDKISSDEFEQAKDDPVMQKELVDKANRLVANNYKFQLPQVEFAEDTGNVVGGAVDAVGDWLTDTFGGIDPTSAEYRDKVLQRQNEEATYNNRLQAIDTLERHINNDLGLEGTGAWNAFWDFTDDSNMDNAAATVAALPAGGIAWQGAKHGINGTRAVVQGGKELLKKVRPKPKAAPKPKNMNEAQTRVDKLRQRRADNIRRKEELRGQKALSKERESQSLVDDILARYE